MTSGTPTRMAAWLESAWLARYLDRQLEGEELAWFEAYLLDKPELLEAVEVDNELKNSLAYSRPNCESILLRGRSVHGDREVDAKVSKVHRFGLPYAPRLLWAASVLIAAGVGWSIKDRTASNLRDAAIIANPARMVFDVMRGDEPSPRLDRPAENSHYILVEIAVPVRASSVKLQAGQKIWHLEPSNDGFASFLVNSSAIKNLDLSIAYDLDGVRYTRSILH